MLDKILRIEVLELLGASYCFHLEEEDETVDTSLLDLMETTLGDTKNLKTPDGISNSALNDISNSSVLGSVKTTEADIKKIQQEQMEAIKRELRTEKFQFENFSSGLQKHNQKSTKLNLKMKDRKKIKVEKENYPQHVLNYHHQTAQPNLPEIKSFQKKKKAAKQSQTTKDENKNMIVENNPRNKCPICLRINIKRMSDHMKTLHPNLPSEVTEKQLQVVVEKIKTDRSRISPAETDVLARVRLEKEKGEKGVYKVISGWCWVCGLACDLSEGRSCSSCSHWSHSHCDPGGRWEDRDICPDCTERERDGDSLNYQTLFPCAICKATRKSALQLRNHYSSVHFRQELEAHIDTRGKCRLCGFASSRASDIVNHVGTTHNMVDSLIPKQISVVFKKLR